MGKSIGIFGGTFDPVHRGHLAIAESFLGSGYVDELWVLLTPVPPHKPKQKPAPYKFREEMLRAAFEGMPRVKVSTLESQLPAPHYTVRTLRYLHKHFPGHPFYLCIGGDSLAHFHTWYQWRKILDLCELVVAQRPGARVKNIPEEILNRSHLVTHEPLSVSSTEVRKLNCEGQSIEGLVPGSVAKLIARHGLYQG